ncbi:MAG: FliA/WhiG family RNA polymerase sigma factor [Calditrichaeota bacterium]|nr:FliA/WhiG family RNA polymerase sigma factor [Calditrichota bacterium]
MFHLAAAPEDVRELWLTYASGHDERTRERLMIHYIPLVKVVAGRMKVGLPGSVVFDDIVSAGLMGLLNCIDNFSPERGFKFETYAVPRIRGAILDGLRDADWLPRSARQKSRRLDQAMEKLTTENGRPPDDREVAQELGLEGDEYNRFMEQAGAAALVSLDTPIAGEEGETGSLHDVVADSQAGDPLAELIEKDAKKCAFQLLDELSEQERTIIALYYYEELTFREIGEVLGVTESRVCQIHTRVIATLRSRLRKTLEE